jgi:hypothetical protein
LLTVSVHRDIVLNFRLASDSSVVRWRALARDGADLPPALRTIQLPQLAMGPGETADFTFVPDRPGSLTLEVWIDRGQRVALPVEIIARKCTVNRETLMNEEQLNISIRRFLKHFGVTAQREIEKAIAAGIADGTLKGTESLKARAVLELDGFGQLERIEGDINLG